MDMIVGKDYDINQLFQEEWQPPKSPLERDKRRGGRLETEEFYLSVREINYFDIYVFIKYIHLLARFSDLADNMAFELSFISWTELRTEMSVNQIHMWIYNEGKKEYRVAQKSKPPPNRIKDCQRD